MTYLSLYRKYRSQSFEDLQGQEHVVRTLQNALQGRRIGHAYLFSGPRGTGKTSTARLLARSLNCERGPTPTPCGECVACQEIRDGVSPSVVEIDAASSRGIDEVRDLRQRAMTVPSQPGARKVFIVDEVHMLTTEACNALLKTLEEPPAHVLFILATTDAQKLPATILSRCQRFEFRRGSVSQIGERIRHVAEAEGCSIDPEAVRLLSRASGGSWRDAISLLEQVLAFSGDTVTAASVTQLLGAVGEETLLELADALAHSEGRIVYPIIERLISEGTEPRQLARDLGEHFRALLMADAGALPGDAYHPETTCRLNEQASAFGTSRLVAALEALAQAEKEMRWSDSGRVVLEVALARLMLRPASGQAARSEASLATQAVGRTSTAQRRTDERPLQPIPAPQSPAGPDAASQSSSGGRSQPGTAAITGSGEAGGPRANGADEAEAAFDPFEHEELPSTTRRPPPQAAPSRASTPASPSSASASSRAAGLDQAQLEARWNVVIEELRRARAVTTATLLAEGRLLRADSEGLVIGFRSATLRDAWERGNHKKQLSTALHAVFGSSLPVRTDLVKEGSPAPPDPEASRSGTSRRPPAAPAISPAAAPRAGGEAAPTPGMLEGEALLHETIALFDGRIVETETE